MPDDCRKHPEIGVQLVGINTVLRKCGDVPNANVANSPITTRSPYDVGMSQRDMIMAFAGNSVPRRRRINP